jgi:hypothetical protein
MGYNFKIKKVEEIYPIHENRADDLFITCGSFEERFLGSLQRLKEVLPNKFILFRFSEQNEKRENLIKEMYNLYPAIKEDKEHEFIVDHGRDIDAIIKFHNYLQNKMILQREISITVDISTFSKNLLLNLIFYINNFLKVNNLRLLYTIPKRYASPDEGWLSFSTKSIHFPLMYCNGISPIKNNLLIIFLGFEEMRAWSLIEKIGAELNWLFVTSPGSIPQWDDYCERYNQRILANFSPKGKISAIEPAQASKILKEHISKNLVEKYNIFVAPLGTKPQIRGLLSFIQ